MNSERGMVEKAMSVHVENVRSIKTTGTTMRNVEYFLPVFHSDRQVINMKPEF
jgi:hypothetical protein